MKNSKMFTEISFYPETSILIETNFCKNSDSYSLLPDQLFCLVCTGKVAAHWRSCDRLTSLGGMVSPRLRVQDNMIVFPEIGFNKNKSELSYELFYCFYSCGLSTATIEYSSPSVCLSVCLSVCVHVNSKIMVQLT